MPASAGLRNLYRQIESGEVDIDDVPTPRPDAPPALGVYFGCQLGWDPAREGGRKLSVEWACDLATRETLVVELCRVCLSGFGDVRLADRVVCMGCLSCSQDPRIVAILAAERLERDRAA